MSSEILNKNLVANILLKKTPNNSQINEKQALKKELQINTKKD